MLSNKAAPPEAQSAAKLERSSVLELYARHYAHALTRFFTRRVDNQSDVADLVQDVFLRLSRLKNLNTIDNPEQYLFATALSALQDKRRRDAVREQGSHDPFDEAGHGRSEISPDRVVAGQQAIERLREAVRELPERTRDVFVLRVFEGLKMADIARALGVSQRAVEKHYAKAIAYVAAQLRGLPG